MTTLAPRNSKTLVAATVAMMFAAPAGATGFDGFQTRVMNTSPYRKLVLSATSPELLIASTPIAYQKPTAADLLALAQNTFGLRVTQLADVFKVSRRSIYDWLGGKEPTRDDNIERLKNINEILSTCAPGSISSKEIGRLLRRPIVNEKSLLALLSEQDLNPDSIQEAFSQLNEEIAQSNHRLAAVKKHIPASKDQLSANETAAELDRLAAG